MIYQWKHGSRLPCDPQAAGERIAALRKQHGVANAELVVKDGRKKTSPFHDVFEWDDSVAGATYRLTQARYILRSVVEVHGSRQPDNIPKRAFTKVLSVEDDEPDYVPRHVVLRTRSLREQFVAQAMKDLSAFRDRYDDVEELSGVCGYIDRTLKHFGKYLEDVA